MQIEGRAYLVIESKRVWHNVAEERWSIASPEEDACAHPVDKSVPCIQPALVAELFIANGASSASLKCALSLKVATIAYERHSEKAE